MKFSVIVGLVLLSFGLVGGFMVDWTVDLMTLPSIHILIGTVLVVSWFFTSGIKNLKSEESFVKGRVTRFSANAFVYILIFLGIIGSVNWIGNRYNQRFDFTEASVFSLSPQTVKVLKNISKPLKIVALKVQGTEKVDEFLDLYKEQNRSLVSTEVFNPDTKPHLLDKYGFKPGNIITLIYGGEGDQKQSQISQSGDSGGTKNLEQDLTNAILKLTKGETKKIYFIGGHGEADIADTQPEGFKSLISALEDEQFSSETLTLSMVEKVPSDASVIIATTPKKAFSSQESEMLKKYAQEGGRLLLLGDANTNDEITKLAENFGVKIRNDIIVDKVQRLFAGPALGVQPVIRTFDKVHPITKEFNQNMLTLFNMSSSVAIDDAKKDPEASYTELAKTGMTAWGETDLNALFNADEPSATLSDADNKPPLSVGVSYEKKLPQAKKEEGDTSFDKVSRVVVFGNSQFASNQMFSIESNRDLILNTISWLSGEEGGVTIRPKEMRKSTSPIKRDAFINILLIGFLVPEAILLLGLSVWWKRRAS